MHDKWLKYRTAFCCIIFLKKQKVLYFPYILLTAVSCRFRSSTSSADFPYWRWRNVDRSAKEERSITCLSI